MEPFEIKQTTYTVNQFRDLIAELKAVANEMKPRDKVQIHSTVAGQGINGKPIILAEIKKRVRKKKGQAIRSAYEIAMEKFS